MDPILRPSHGVVRTSPPRCVSREAVEESWSRQVLQQMLQAGRTGHCQRSLSLNILQGLLPCCLARLLLRERAEVTKEPSQSIDVLCLPEVPRGSNPWRDDSGGCRAGQRMPSHSGPAPRWMFGGIRTALGRSGGCSGIEKHSWWVEVVLRAWQVWQISRGGLKLWTERRMNQKEASDDRNIQERFYGFPPSHHYLLWHQMYDQEGSALWSSKTSSSALFLFFCCSSASFGMPETHGLHVRNEVQNG